MLATPRQPPRPIPWLEANPQALAWRWRLAGERRPSVERTADVAQAITAALNETARAMFGAAVLPPDLHIAATPPPRSDDDGRETHTHAFFLPEDLDGDGVLDHAAVVLSPRLGAGGFTRRGLAILAACPGVWLESLDVGFEALSLAATCPFGLDRPARVWTSLSPFVPPLLRGDDPAAQIVRSLARVGLPAPATARRSDVIVTRDGRQIAAGAFAPTGPARRRWRENPAYRAQASRMGFWTLTFDEAVAGPLSIGALSHFGLGRFASAAE